MLCQVTIHEKCFDIVHVTVGLEMVKNIIVIISFCLRPCFISHKQGSFQSAKTSYACLHPSKVPHLELFTLKAIVQSQSTSSPVICGCRELSTGIRERVFGTMHTE